MADVRTSPLGELDIGEVFGDAWQSTRRRWRLALVIVAVTGGGISAIELSFEETDAVRLQGLFGFITLYLELVFMVRLLRDRGVLAGRPHDTGGPTLGKFIPAVGQSIVWTICLCLGLLLLILPGIALATLWFVCLPAMLAENRPVFRSFARSYELVRPCFREVLSIVLLLGVAYIGALAALIFAFPVPYLHPSGLGWLLPFLIANIGVQAVQLGGWALCVATYLRLVREPIGTDLEEVFA